MACRAALLGALVATAATVTGTWAAWSDGLVAAQAVAIAALACGLPSAAALALAAIFQGRPQAVTALLGGMVMETTVPLVAGVVTRQFAAGLVEAGLLGWLVVFFLLALTAKTLLLVPLFSTPPRRAPAPLPAPPAERAC